MWHGGLVTTNIKFKKMRPGPKIPLKVITKRRGYSELRDISRKTEREGSSLPDETQEQRQCLRSSQQLKIRQVEKWTQSYLTTEGSRNIHLDFWPWSTLNLLMIPNFC